jgi:hypothetical protein
MYHSDPSLYQNKYIENKNNKKTCKYRQENRVKESSNKAEFEPFKLNAKMKKKE